MLFSLDQERETLERAQREAGSAALQATGCFSPHVSVLYPNPARASSLLPPGTQHQLPGDPKLLLPERIPY